MKERLLFRESNLSGAQRRRSGLSRAPPAGRIQSVIAGQSHLQQTAASREASDLYPVPRFTKLQNKISFLFIRACCQPTKKGFFSLSQFQVSGLSRIYYDSKRKCLIRNFNGRDAHFRSFILVKVDSAIFFCTTK